MYYAVKFHYDIRFPVWGMTIVVLALILIGELIALSSYKILIREFLSTLQSLFASRGWHLFGALLAGLIFLPLVFHASRQAIRSKAMQDLVAIGSFLLFVLLLYLPFGFESIAQFEDWVYHSWLDGHAFDFMTRELTLRFWEIVPHTLAHFINSDSFVPLHLVNFLILWSRMVMLYGILRHLNVNRLYAFLVTMLFMVYPVNSALMSLRSLPWQFSSTALLAAVYLMLTFRAAPSRLRLLGIWLCLIFSIGANEAGYVLILVIPLLWCLRDRPMRWKPFNLTVLWYLFPAFKVVYLLLLLLNNVSFHNDWLLDGSRTWLQRTGASIVETGIYHVLNVYRVTFLEGWQVAWTALQQKSFVPVTAFMLLLVGTVSWYLLLQSHQEVVALPAPAWFRPVERFAVYRPGAWCTDLDREVQQRPVATVLLCADWRSDRGLQLDCVIDAADCKASTSQQSSRSYLYTPDGSCGVPSPFATCDYRRGCKQEGMDTRSGARTGAIYRPKGSFDFAD